MSEKKSVIHAYTRFCLLLAVAAGTARGDVAATSVTTNGTELTIAVKGGETLNYDSRPLSIFTSIVKEGDGKAYFNHGVAITNAFTGTITVNAGILGATSIDNYGTPTVVTVASGASLDLTSASGAPKDPQTMYKARAKLVMGGTELAYFSDNKLYVTRLEAVNQISIGTSANGFLDIVTTPTGVGFKWRS